MPLPPAKKKEKKEKNLACIREILVHKLWTKVYPQKGLTAMVCVGACMCAYVCMCVCVCVCVLDGEKSRVVASIALVVVWTAMYITTFVIL